MSAIGRSTERLARTSHRWPYRRRCEGTERTTFTQETHMTLVSHRRSLILLALAPLGPFAAGCGMGTDAADEPSQSAEQALVNGDTAFAWAQRRPGRSTHRRPAPSIAEEAPITSRSWGPDDIGSIFRRFRRRAVATSRCRPTEEPASGVTCPVGTQPPRRFRPTSIATPWPAPPPIHNFRSCFSEGPVSEGPTLPTPGAISRRAPTSRRRLRISGTLAEAPSRSGATALANIWSRSRDRIERISSSAVWK